MSERQLRPKLVVLDSSAIINGYDPASSISQHLISSSAADEIKDSKSKRILETAIIVGKLRVVEPTKQAVKKVEEVAVKTGDRSFLSKADIETIAIAVEARERGVEPIIMTDDFTIQNVAAHMGIKCLPIVTRGIKEKLKWIKYCPACGATYTSKEIDKCIICGTPLKRKSRS
ncbi:MAG: ribonuclease VapC [Candidatus Methanomethylicota archaeon]|uniref:Ribonuclease VapC n=1 Tax=Thermoproteota archaeon TaxID=2056631 RepID=A0A497EVP9_9CREN|nr:MAG: ribonuclease VapC [Candidatus Verstraetearchaeota archaeon]